METHSSPKHRSIPWRHSRPSSAHFGLDGTWGFTRIPGEASKGKSARPCTRLSHRAGANLECSPVHQLHDVAEALSYIHSRNMVHGNVMGVCAPRLTNNLTDITITQTNILVDRFGRARIMDFSLTTVHPNQVSNRGVSELRGNNTRWTAPEVSEEIGPLTEKVDVFSFAMLMVEVRFAHVAQKRPVKCVIVSMKAFTGAIPFHNFQDVTAILEICKGGRPPRPTDSTLSDDVWVLMRRCWDQSPQLRPEMSGVVRDLASSLLRSLFSFTKASREFQVALTQFYDGTNYKEFVGRLRDVEEFVIFLDAVRNRSSLLDRDPGCNLSCRYCVSRDWMWICCSGHCSTFGRCAATGKYSQSHALFPVSFPGQPTTLLLRVDMPKYGVASQALGEGMVARWMCASR